MKAKRSLSRLPGRLLALAGLLALLVFAALGAAPASAASSHHATPSGQHDAFVRVVHASPGAGPVDVFVDGQMVLNDFLFGSVTGYVTLPAGEHRIQVAPHGQGTGHSVINVTVKLQLNVYYTAAALGTQSSGFSLAVFIDHNGVADGAAKVRVYHLSPNSGPVKVAVGGKTVIKYLTYQQASGYLSVPPGDYTFEVTAIKAHVTVPVKAALSECTVNSVFAIGLFGGQPPLQFVLASVNSNNSCED